MSLNDDSRGSGAAGGQGSKGKVVQLSDYLSQDEERGSGTAGGQGGRVEFREFIGRGTVSSAEEKRLLGVHKEVNGGIVENQKRLRDQYKDLKEGKTAGHQQQGGMGSQFTSDFAQHPILSKSQQLDGMDPAVSLNPNLHQDDANPNADKKQELTLKHQLELHPEMAPENQPRYSPPRPMPPS